MIRMLTTLAMMAGLGLLWSAVEAHHRRRAAAAAAATDAAVFTRAPEPAPAPRRWVAEWWLRAGLTDVDVREFGAVVGALAVLGAVLGWAVFGGPVPALAVGACLAAVPFASDRLRRQQRSAAAQEAWPRMLEEIRILATSLGCSVPQALFEAGRRAPESLRPAFAAAQREWLLSTDFERTVAVLKAGLADPTADAACETLLVAHEVGGTDLDRRLDALIEDRILDVQGRKDARAKQAGVRFARRFVLLVPLGMALVGLSIGNGKAAYATAWGQLMVAIGLSAIVACWVWAGRLLALPAEERVFYE
jgi:tight adherence protein B